MTAGGPWLQFVPFLIVIPVALGLCMITKKTGRHWSLGLLWLVPGVNLFVLGWLALSQWPIEVETQRLREAVAVLQGRTR